jgi:dolichol-phosphate mannosyltransferase
MGGEVLVSWASGRNRMARIAAIGHRVAGWLRLSLVGASGLVVNQVLLLLLTELGGVFYLVSAAVATLGSSTWNFAWVERWVFARRTPGSSSRRRYGAFLALNFALLPARLPILFVLTEAGGIHYAWSNAISLVALFAIRVLAADLWLWRSRPTAAADTVPTARTIATADRAESPRYRYDVGGLVAIDSDVELRELRHFKVDDHAKDPDIRLRIGLVSPRPSGRVVFEENGDELVYREHLGPLSANFSLRMGEPIDIRVAPMLALSPHVVYTNIVEAFLRFLLVSKGYVLLHSAAIADASGVTLLSAQTDTGKTSTVISLVRSHGYRFLSDDMTILDPTGVAISYPKPMTLSFHTMRVARDGQLTMRDRAALAVQSRVHSKSGRTVGRSLGSRNLPIMTMNAAVQLVVPPPKYRIDTLFDCVVGGRGPIRNVVLMERGESTVAGLGLRETVRQLIENTDDAYGFPPFSTFAPRIRIGGDDYAALRRKEEQLLGLAVGSAELWRLSVPGHEWADVLPSIIGGDRPLPHIGLQPPVAAPRGAVVQPDFEPQFVPVEVGIGE